MFKVNEIAAATGGTLLQGDGGTQVTHVSMDSRTLRPGAAFFALSGERHDGHAFLQQATDAGATCLVVRRTELGSVAALPAEVAVVGCPEPLAALQAFAAWHRNRFDVPVIGVTGSAGKTSTKEMVAAILRRRGPIVATSGNQNTDIGLPLTLLRLRTEDWACVVEMGMRAPGEIANLARWARPTVGVVTNVGKTHIAELGSIEGIAAAKRELPEALGRDGWAVLNADDPRVRAFAEHTTARVRTFGYAPGADVRATDVRVQGLDGLTFTVEGMGEQRRLRLRLPGRHQVGNALAAVAATLAAGATWEEIETGLAQVVPSRQRMETSRFRKNVTLVNDAYNAAPASMQAALHTLFELVCEGRKVAVLGDMLELGEWSERAHRDIGSAAAQGDLDLLVAVGDHARSIAAAAAADGLPSARILWYVDGKHAAAAADSWMREGDTVLVKASRGMGLEVVAEAVRRWAGEGEDDSR